MPQRTFFTGLIRLLSVYLLFLGLNSLVQSLPILFAQGFFSRPELMTEAPGRWVLFLPTIAYFALAVGMFLAAPWFASVCLGRKENGAPEDPTPAIEEVLVFASGFIVAALALLEAANLLIWPLLELRKPEFQRNTGAFDDSVFLRGFIAIALSGTGLSVMLHFHRVHGWMKRRRGR